MLRALKKKEVNVMYGTFLEIPALDRPVCEQRVHLGFGHAMVVVAFSSLARSLGECSTIHSPPALFCCCCF